MNHVRPLAGLLVLILCGAASAQPLVVQLPTVNTFSVQTSVLVPDSGTAYLGGVGRAAQARSQMGWSPLGRTTSRAGAVIGSGVMVHATIHDHAEIDRALLDEARSLRSARGFDDSLGSATIPVARTETKPIRSVAEIKRANAEKRALEEAEAAVDYETARAYEQSGDYSLARSYYRVAARKSNGAIREQALARLATLP